MKLTRISLKDYNIEIMMHKYSSTSHTAWVTLVIGLLASILSSCDEFFEFNPDLELKPTSQIRVVFVTNGGSPIASQPVSKNATVSPPTQPTKNGATFAGWFTSDSNYTNGNKFNFDTPITRKTILYAGWKYTISLNPNGGSFATSSGGTTSLVVVGGSSATIPINKIQAPTKGDAPFAGWFNSALSTTSDIGEKKLLLLFASLVTPPYMQDGAIHLPLSLITICLHKQGSCLLIIRMVSEYLQATCQQPQQSLMVLPLRDGLLPRTIKLHLIVTIPSLITSPCMRDGHTLLRLTPTTKPLHPKFKKL